MNRISRIVALLAAFTVSSQAFTVQHLSRQSKLVHGAINDEIVAAATGVSSKADSIDQLIQAASSVTKESATLLGKKSVGVDYGLVRTGVAVTVGYDPKPLAILADLNRTEVCKSVIDICRSEQTNQVIVGLPLHKNGTEANQTTITREFAQELAEHVLQYLGPNIPVYMWDERYTSKEAAARAHSKNPNKDLYGQLDADAACIILENYYDDNGKDAERVSVSPDLYDKYEQIWKERKTQEESRLQEAQKGREERMQWRKQAMERDRLLEETLNATGQSSSKKKKKKKKRKKRGPWIIPGEKKLD